MARVDGVDYAAVVLVAVVKTQGEMNVDEIAPVSIPQRKGDPVVFDTDEQPRASTTAESLAKLRPAFKKDGSVTAGNSSTLNDGASAVMLMAVLNWFSCYHIVMTSDKFMYLFGRVIPATSLVFSMVLRFVPRLKARFHVVSNAQKCVGRDVSDGKTMDKDRPKRLTKDNIDYIISIEANR